MAYVTRCPYCNCVWLLPDKETADRGPVKCSSCNHSFDATCALLTVPDVLFPGHMPPKPVIAPVIQPTVKPLEAIAPEAVPTTPPPPPTVQKRFTDLNEMMSDFANRTESAEPPAAPQTEPVEPAPAQQPAATAEPVAAPAPDTDCPPAQPETPAPAPGQELPAEPALGEAAAAPSFDSVAHIVPADTQIQPESHGVINVDAPDRAPRQPAAKGSFVSIILSFVLLLALGAVLAIVFNQKVLELLPQSKDLYTQMCSKVPCPGFYLSNIEAFIVSKTRLRPLDESGNYDLEVTLVNGSDTAQAIPNLEIELVDDNDTTLLRRIMNPEEFLENAENTKSLPKQRHLTVRVSLQTNVTPARCIVTPRYSIP